MSRQARFQPSLQKLVLLAYQSIGFGDASASEALTAGATNDGAVSDKLVSAWRSGGEHVSEMSVGALDVLLAHSGDKAGRILQVLCRRYGYEAVRQRAAGQAECIERLRNEAAAELGDLHRLNVSDDPARVAREAHELLAVAQRLADAADERAAAAKGAGLPLRHGSTS